MADPSNKRKEVQEGESLGPNEGAIVLKKQKTDELAISQSAGSKSAIITAPVPRTSSLLSPIMLLSGHKGEVYSTRFSPSGNHIASGSFDKTICLWKTFGECENYMLFRGHQGAVLEVAWFSDEKSLVSCSSDKTLQVFDVEHGVRLRKLTGHTSYVNSCSPVRRGPPFVCSGSDDGTVKLWDARVKTCSSSYASKYAVTAVCFSDAGDQIFSGGIDNDIKVWDVRNNKEPSMTMVGHEDTISGLRLSPDGSYLLTNSMDLTVRIWDIRPFVQGHRNLKIFQGAQHNFEKLLLRCTWSSDGTKVSAGSADRFVYIWETTSRRILYKLPGHRGSVNDVDFHPKEPIIASGSSDHTIYLGEIKPQ